jgi:hypothetical protein
VSWHVAEVGDGFADHTVIGAAIVGGPEEFVSHVGNRLEEKLAEVGEGGRMAGGDAAVGQGFEDFGQDVVDVGAVVEVAGEGGKFLAELIGFEELLFFAHVEGAKGGMALHAEHTATATIGELAFTEIVTCFGRADIHVRPLEMD